MECSRIPAAEEWEQFSTQQQDLFREHLEYCSNCRKRLAQESPEKLLFQLADSPMPEDFWIGFVRTEFTRNEDLPEKCVNAEVLEDKTQTAIKI